MTSRAASDQDAMVAALRTVLAADPSDAGQPGLLRTRLEATLGPEEAVRLRRELHQVVAAAEDNLPMNLTRIAPLTLQSLDRLSTELADTRGWTPVAARRITQVWATALGFEELVASSWPRRPMPDRPTDDARPAPSTLPRMEPPSDAPAPRSRGADVAWPRPAKSLRHLTQSRRSETALGVAAGYSGMPLPAFVASISGLLVVLCAPVLLIGATGFLLPVVGVLVASLLVRKLGFGVLMATDSGVEYTPYDGARRKERPERGFTAPWSEITVTEGLVSSVRVGAHRIQLGPRNRDFARALLARRNGRM